MHIKPAARPHLLLTKGLAKLSILERQGAEYCQTESRKLANVPLLRQKLDWVGYKSTEHGHSLSVMLRHLDASTPLASLVAQSLRLRIRRISLGPRPDPLCIIADIAALQAKKIACYRASVELARLAGEESLIPELDTLLQEDEETIAWLQEHLPAIVARQAGAPRSDHACGIPQATAARQLGSNIYHFAEPHRCNAARRATAVVRQ